MFAYADWGCIEVDHTERFSTDLASFISTDLLSDQVMQNEMCMKQTNKQKSFIDYHMHFTWYNIRTNVYDTSILN